MVSYNAVMELKELINNITAQRSKLFMFCVLGALAGVVAFYLIPQTYDAIGSFLVQRRVEETKSGYFSYEGYYAQQTSRDYANNLAILMESPDIKRKALEVLDLPITEKNLRNLERHLSVKKSDAAVVTLTATANSPKEAEDTWNAVADSTLNLSMEINAKNDNLITVNEVSTTPVIKPSFKNVYLDFVIGAGIGFMVFVAGLYINSYLKEQK